ncbi:MAG TPA: lipid-A-disaccharide synthase [Gemmatimonadales bacterium]
MKAPARVFVSAGEPSGDAHAASVVRALLRRRPDTLVEAFGGPLLRSAGATVRFPMEPYTVLGLFEALGKIPAHLRLLRTLRGDFAAGRYDLVLLVDYPGFNLRLAESAHRAGLPTLYYVAPQLWAWRPGRARRLARAVDCLAVVLPFEADFFRRHGVPCEFVGHPLAERDWPSRDMARRELGLPAEERIVAMFPGSRQQEIERLWPDFRDAGQALVRERACDRVLVAGREAAVYPGVEVAGLTLVTGRADSVLAAADAAVVKSGTTTLEAACTGTPMVVAYRVHPIWAMLVRRMVTVRWFSLVNLVAGEPVVPELIQRQVSARRLVEAVRPLLEPTSCAANTQREALARVRRRLGPPGAAERVAGMVEELLAA